VSRYRRWNIGPLGTGDRTLILAQQNERIIVDRIWITNKDSSNRNVDMHHLPADDGVNADDYGLIHDHTITRKAYEDHRVADLHGAWRQAHGRCVGTQTRSS
jgi:hypothetical protein